MHFTNPRLLLAFLINSLLAINARRAKVTFAKQYKIRSLTEYLQQIIFNYVTAFSTGIFLKAAADEA